jgi:uncharacterized membrane protein YgaE (UPF0421/DUF939 family)
MSRRRVRASAWPVAQASVGAAIAWWITHNVMGHPQPFFAPIAAAIALSTTGTRRARRSVQMLLGVLLGIAIGEALGSLLGTDAVALGVVVFVTMIVALAIGASFLGEGMMFANQAAASAILVIALHRQGTGAERALDAVVGAAVAIVIGTVMFPANPLRMIRDAESDVLRAMASAVREVLRALREKDPKSAEWTLAETARIHGQLARLDQARQTARATARIAPRRWSMREEVAREDMRVAQMDLLANAILSLIRATAAAADGPENLSAHLDHQLSQLCGVLDAMADAGRPWPVELVNDIEALARSILEDTAVTREFPVVISILETTARDLLRVVR